MRPHYTVLGLVLAISIGLLSACAASRFDELYEARDYAAAARAFEDDPSLHTDARALYRAGMIHAAPKTATYDPASARPLLERLVTEHPSSEYVDAAHRTLAFLAEIERLEDDVVRLATEAGVLNVEVDHLRTLIERLDERSEREDDQIELLGQMVKRLETELRNRDRRIRALEEELEQLKAIDLRPKRPATPSDSATATDSAAARDSTATGDPSTTADSTVVDDTTTAFDAHAGAHSFQALSGWIRPSTRE